MYKPFICSLFLFAITAPLRADFIQLFTDRAAWTAAVEAFNGADPIETETFNRGRIHTGITLQSIPYRSDGYILDPSFLQGAPGAVADNKWTSQVHSNGISNNNRFDLLTFPQGVDAIGGEYVIPWSGEKSGLEIEGLSSYGGTGSYFYNGGYVPGETPLLFDEIVQRDGPNACGGITGGTVILPACPKNHPLFTRGFFGVLDFSELFSSVAIGSLTNESYQETGHGGAGRSYTLDNLSFQDPPNATPEPATWGFLSLGLLALTRVRRAHS